jgi:glycosyltransferase involved in cell wall biosynthesis
MRIAVITPLMKSGEQGGAEVLYRGLVRALREASHVVEPIEVIIDESSFDAILDGYVRCYDLNLAGYDLVISTKAPTFMVRHPNHVTYLFHTIRAFYDMFEREYGSGTREQHQQRRVVHRLDKYGLHPERVRKHFAIGEQPYTRLCQADAFWRTVPFKALHPPPLLEGFKAPRRGEYIFLPSRLHRWKRVDLVIQSFNYIKSNIALKIVGTGEDEPVLRELAKDDPRIEFLGRVSDEELVDLYAGALAVPFVPLNEDYGFVTIEAFKSKKPVITCEDSGEPAHIVKNLETGFVVEPEPQAIAQKIEYLVGNPEHAAEMGSNGYASVSYISWDTVIAGLTSSAHKITCDGREKSFFAFKCTATETGTQAQRVTVLDMQPIEPPVGGGRVRLLGLYHALGKNLLTTYVGTYDWPGENYRVHQHSPTLQEITIPLSAQHFAAVQDWQARAGGKNIIDVSFAELAHYSPAFLDEARTQVSKADIVVFSHPWVYPLVRDQLSERSRLVIYDSQNVEGLLRFALLNDDGFGMDLVKRAIKSEYALCNWADLVLACSHEDRQLFHELYGVPYGKILVVPNGTFARRIEPADAPKRQEMKRQLGITKPMAIFIGSAYQPNIEAAEFICQKLASAMPEIDFVLCGDVGAALRGASLPPNVHVTGRLDESEKLAYLAAADLAMNPMSSGSGTNIKMFDYMAAGLPIVSTPVGARGISAGSADAFIVCPAEGFAHSIRRIVRGEDYAYQLGAAARRLAEEKYSWELISAQLGLHLARARSNLDKICPYFSVVIATYERHGLLKQLCESLAEQTFKNFEVIIVDQSSSPWQDQAHFPDLDMLYIHTEVKGAVRARNTAASYARGQVLAFTDDDCLLAPDWLENALKYFNEPENVGVEGLILSDKRDDPNYRAVTNLGFEGVGFMTANLFICRETFHSIDGFDERFDHPHFREDTDLGWRACAQGKIPFARDVVVFHPPHPRTLAREAQTERARFFQKDALLMSKHPQLYRSLFLGEAHYLHTDGFRENFLRGAEKYGVKLDDFYLSLLSESPEQEDAGLEQSESCNMMPRIGREDIAQALA